MSKRLTEEEKKARALARKVARKEAARMDRQLEEARRPPVKSLTITIEWKPSRIYGTTPHGTAEVRYHGGRYEMVDGFRTQGCGYDKTSTIAADMFNRFLIYKLWRKRPEDPKPYGVAVGVDYRYFEGGIGMTCFPAIAEYIGGKWEVIASGRSFDVFRYVDGEATT